MPGPKSEGLTIPTGAEHYITVLAFVDPIGYINFGIAIPVVMPIHEIADQLPLDGDEGGFNGPASLLS